MRCPNCKQEIDDDSMFCEWCGKRIPQATFGQHATEKREVDNTKGKKSFLKRLLTLELMDNVIEKLDKNRKLSVKQKKWIKWIVIIPFLFLLYTFFALILYILDLIFNLDIF